jgi:hypothetical protein
MEQQDTQSNVVLENNSKSNLLDINEKNEELVQREYIDETPFTVVSHENSHYVLMGTNRMHNEPFKTKEEAIQNAKTMDWEKLIQVIFVVFQDLIKNKQLEVNEKENGNN